MLQKEDASTGLAKYGPFLSWISNHQWDWVRIGLVAGLTASAVVAFFGVVVLGTLQGIMVAVIASLLALLYLAGHPPVYVVGRKPSMDVFRPLGDHLEQAMEAYQEIEAVPEERLIRLTCKISNLCWITTGVLSRLTGSVFDYVMKDLSET